MTPSYRFVVIVYSADFVLYLQNILTNIVFLKVEVI